MVAPAATHIVVAACAALAGGADSVAWAFELTGPTDTCGEIGTERAACRTMTDMLCVFRSS